jgi:hypothetical protein
MYRIVILAAFAAGCLGGVPPVEPDAGIEPDADTVDAPAADAGACCTTRTECALLDAMLPPC